MTLPSISAVIVTLNEEARISRAILSVKQWVDEVIVVDMMSEDQTSEIALSLGAKVFQHPRVGFVEPARATAVAYAACDWILILDSDEMISFSLSQELLRVAEHNICDVCRLPRINYILGKAMLHGQHSPDRDTQVRFFKKHSLQFSDRIHSFPEPQKGMRLYTVPFVGARAIHHFHAATASQLIDKMNRYTTTEAEQVYLEGKRAAIWRLLLLPPVFFLRGYFSNQGWRDGWRGFYWAALMTFYRLTREAKHLQFFESSSVSNDETSYSWESAELLREYYNDDDGDSHRHKVDVDNTVSKIP